MEGLKTTIKDPTLQSVTANVTFMSADKTAALSNNLRVNLNLGQEGTLALATTGEDAATEEGVLVEESEQEQAPGPFQKPDQQRDEGEDTKEDDEDGEQQELPLPLFRK